MIEWKICFGGLLSTYRTVCALLKRDISIINDEDDASNTPLHLAALLGNDKVAKELLERGAAIDARSAAELCYLVESTITVTKYQLKHLIFKWWIYFVYWHYILSLLNSLSSVWLVLWVSFTENTLGTIEGKGIVGVANSCPSAAVGLLWQMHLSPSPDNCWHITGIWKATLPGSLRHNLPKFLFMYSAPELALEIIDHLIRSQSLLSKCAGMLIYGHH